VDLIEDGANGLLVDVRSPKAFAQGLQRLFESPETRARMGQRALNMVRPFLLQNVKAEMARIYERVIELAEQNRRNSR
jgi:glycosyltransferase involved in cell wall biosynthesis